MFFSSIESYPLLVLTVVKYEHRIRESLEQFKAVLELADGSYLHVNEVWLDRELRKYAYYWLSPADVIICGWDNAPPHREVSTYPHHVHQPDAVVNSDVRSLADVLEILQQLICE